jgi:hypothetical protein
MPLTVANLREIETASSAVKLHGRRMNERADGE